MVSPPLCRVAYGANLGHLTTSVCRPCVLPITTSQHTTSRHRRPSSSKTSYPPGAPKPTDQAARDSPNGNTTEEQPRDRRGLAGFRRRARLAADRSAATKPEIETFPHKVPSVPSTQHLSDSDIHLSSLFALHRPISVATSIPGYSSQSSFNRMFDPPPVNKLHTPTQNVSAEAFLDKVFNKPSGQGKDLRHEILQSSMSHNFDHSRTVHLDGAPSVDQIVKAYPPFHKPPPPVPVEVRKNGSAQRRRPNNREKAVNTFAELTGLEQSVESQRKERGQDAGAQDPYNIELGPWETKMLLRGLQRHGDRKSHTSFQRAPSSVQPSRPPHQPFLRRMRIRASRQRHRIRSGFGLREAQNDEGATDKARDPLVKPNMLLISVKRQRKLKMKKHKYKKLMRRTRTLRRREGRV